MEDTLNPKEDSSKDVTEILPTIEKESETEEIEEADMSLNDSELYEGFDEEGKRILDDN